MRTYNPLVKPMPLVNELGLSLAVKCIQVSTDGQRKLFLY